MKVAVVLLLAAVAYTSAQQRQCTPTDFTFLFDYSEKANAALTTDPNPPNGRPTRFDILENQWKTLMSRIMDTYPNVDIRVRAVGFSSISRDLVSRGTPADAYNGAFINRIPSGGSWTHLGLEFMQDIQATPQRTNVIVVVSAAATGNPNKRAMATDAYRRLRNNGWTTRVIGIQLPGNRLDMTELNGITESPVQIITSGSNLADALYQVAQESIQCRIPITLPPFTRPPITLPPTTGICSSCKRRDADSFFYDSHDMCDGYYQCLPDKSYVAMGCGQGLWWDSEKLVCDYPKNVICATATCSKGQRRNYPSYLCCNKYFACNDGVITYEKCPAGQLFFANSQTCQTVNNVTASCDRHYCDERISTFVGNCDGYEPDPTGNPCQFYHNGDLKKTAAGTRWNQASCSQVSTEDGTCNVNVMDRALDASSDCNALVISTFDDNTARVFSQRVNDLNLYMIQSNVTMLQNALVFNNRNPVAYYYFFANNELQTNSAFRMVFQLNNRAQNRAVYDLFSNNFCVQCPETIGATVSMNGANSYEIITTLTDSITRSRIQTRTQVQTNQQGAWLDLRLIWGESEVYGQINILDSNKRFVRAVAIERVQHRSSANILPNKCGLLLGAGANQVFQGMVDEFAYYTACSNIDDVLTKIPNSDIF